MTVGAKSDKIISSSTSSNASRVIVSIRVSFWTSRLEYLRIHRRFTRLRVPKASRTAIPRRVKSETSALACHDSPIIVGSDLKTNWAHGVQIAHAPGVAALTGAFERRNGNRKIVAVDKADIVEILVVSQGNLSECRRRCAADSVAEEVASAVSGGAASAARGVEGAAVATPESAGPERWEAERVGFVRCELEASSC